MRGLWYHGKKLLFALFVFSAAFPLYAEPLYTITVRGLNKQFPLIAWQMTYRITAASQRGAELTALENARRDGCDGDSAYIVETTVTLTPGDARAAAPVIVITPASPPPAPKDEPKPDYEEAYRAGCDHGVTGFLTGRGNFILNHEIPEKYREAGEEQGYKNGYAKGYAEEQAKAELRNRRPSPPRNPAPARSDTRR